MRDTLIAAYMDYFNNYLSVERYSEVNGLTDEEGKMLIDLARLVASHEDPES